MRYQLLLTVHARAQRRHGQRPRNRVTSFVTESKRYRHSICAINKFSASMAIGLLAHRTPGFSTSVAPFCGIGYAHNYQHLALVRGQLQRLAKLVGIYPRHHHVADYQAHILLLYPMPQCKCFSAHYLTPIETASALSYLSAANAIATNSPRQLLFAKKTI